MQVQEQGSDQRLCPNLTANWRLGQISHSNQVVLASQDGKRQVVFTEIEGFALRYFTGAFPISHVQRICEDQYGDLMAPDGVSNLVQTLVSKNILEPDYSFPLSSPTPTSTILKPCVEWISHPDGYWILRNPEEITFLQVSHRNKQVIDQLGQLTPTELEQHFEISTLELQGLIRMLATTGMVVGSSPSQPPQRQWLNPLHLLLFRIPLFNPDPWLSRHAKTLRWVWTQPIAMVLTVFLTTSWIVGMNHTQEIVLTGQKLWTTQGGLILIPFILLCGLVVALHELAHAFTLKHYGGSVKEIGLLVMCLMPGCYTDTTDAYRLVKRRQRLWVVGAGIVCQCVIWAMALWLWLLLSPGTWLKTTSFLVMVAALLTVAVNLNPLAKFDGYYLAGAATGINNLRSRSVLFYLNLVRGRMTRERSQDRWILAVYAPFSVLYTVLVFGRLLLWLVECCLTHIPALALGLLLLWTLSRLMLTFLSNQASPMTASQSTQPQVHPQGTELSATTPPPTPASKFETTPQSIRVPNRWLLSGALCLGSVGILLLPMPDTVTGDTTILSTPGLRQTVTMPEAATVHAIYVRQNDPVRVGQLLAELSSHTLEQQRIDLERKLAEAEAERETARQRLSFALSKQAEAQVRSQNQAMRSNRLQQELVQLEHGQAPPRIRQLQSQQKEKVAQMEGLQAQLAIVNAQSDRYQQLVTEGAMPLAKLDEVKREAISLETQIRSLETQVATGDEQIASTQKEMQDDLLQRRQPEVIEAHSALRSMEQDVAIAATEVEKWEQQLPLLHNQQQRLLRQQQTLKLRATVAGVVVTADLDVLEGQKIAEGKELLTVAGATQPSAILELPQSEAQRVRVGMPVTVRLQDGGLEGFRATVQEVSPITAQESPPQTQQKGMVKVRLMFKDTPQAFPFGTKGYAHVQVGQVLLYQKVQRELLKLIPVGRFI